MQKLPQFAIEAIKAGRTLFGAYETPGYDPMHPEKSPAYQIESTKRCGDLTVYKVRRCIGAGKLFEVAITDAGQVEWNCTLAASKKADKLFASL